MRTTASSSTSAERWPLVLGLYAVIGGLTSLSGYVFDIPRLTDWAGTGISIQPNASVAVVMSGLSLVCLVMARRRAATVLAALVVLIGASTIFEYLSGVNLGTDALLLFGRTWGRTGVIVPGRMGPPGATSWTLIGIGVMYAASGSDRQRAWAPILGFATSVLSGLSLIGYLYGANVLYTIPTATVIAFQTSTFIFALSIGLISAMPEHGFARLVRDQGAAGLLVRRTLPAVIVLPIALGFIRLFGERAGLYDLAFGTAARTLFEIVLLVALLWWTADAIRAQTVHRQKAEAERRNAEASLNASRHQFAEQLSADLADSRVLQQLSADIVYQADVESLYEQITVAAASIARSQFASMQILDAEANELVLIAAHRFTDQARSLWKRVRIDSGCTCGLALRTGARAIVEDVTTSPEIAAEHRAGFRETGIRSCQSTPLVSRSGRIIGMLSTHWDRPHRPGERELGLMDILARLAADLLERRASEQALIEADRRKDEFLATLAHELRNPLAPIRSAVDVMKNRLPADSELATARDVIDRQVELLSRLLDDLLDVSRIARDKLELRTRPVDVRSSIESAVELCRPLLGRAGHHLEIDVPTAPLYVDGDPVRLSQILGNLLHNAAKFTPRGGAIRVKAAATGGDAIISVRDAGIGIRADRLAGVFDLFSQFETPSEPSQSGLGIGLYLVRRLVEMHGGRVSVTSEGPDRGSEFTVSLPLASPVTDSSAQQDVAAVPVPRVPRRVLIVDDNVDAATSLAMLLELGGNETHVAHDGLQAIREAERVQPELILLDLGLPHMNGFEACRHIRAQPWGRDIVVVALTGWGQAVDRQRSHEAGFDHHIVKPVEHDVLMSLLESVGELRAPGRAQTHSVS